MFALRGYQERCISEARALYAQGKRAICIVAPCGAGKTVLGATIATGAATRGHGVLWLAHRGEIRDQARAKLPPEVRVATIQGLLANGERPAADVVVLDECHHLAADLWGTLADHYRDALRIGLTATPERSDGRPLGDLFDSMVVTASYSELLAGGWLVPCDVIAPADKDSTLALPPAEAVLTYAAGRRTIVFCSTVEESRAAARALFPDARHVDGETGSDDRAASIQDFRIGKARVLTNVYVCSEGFDVPETEVCVLARGAGHASTYLQMAGRILRPAPGKKRALLVDLCGSVHEHGFPTDDRTYSLEGRAITRRGEAQPVIWQCKACGRVYPEAPADRRCPLCRAWMPEPKQLVIRRRRLEQKERDALATHDTKQAALAHLQAVARMRGYKSGWAAVVFHRKFGHWPGGSRQ